MKVERASTYSISVDTESIFIGRKPKLYQFINNIYALSFDEAKISVYKRKLFNESTKYYFYQQPLGLGKF